MSRPTERHHLPRETFRDWLNEFRQDLKYRYMPFRAYYRLRAQKYMRFKDRELRLLRHLVPAGKDSLDIGANLGLFTYFLARYSRHVYAFEPNPYPLRSLRSVIDRNVTLLEMAVSERCGEAELVVPKGPRGWSSNGASLEVGAHVRALKVTVPCTSIDALGYRDIGFIKIDIEGHETTALKGARETIARERPNLIIENEVSHAGAQADEAFSLLDDMGYEGFALIDGVLTTLARFSRDDHQVARRGGPRASYVRNFIFLPR